MYIISAVELFDFDLFVLSERKEVSHLARGLVVRNEIGPATKGYVNWTALIYEFEAYLMYYRWYDLVGLPLMVHQKLSPSFAA